MSYLAQPTNKTEYGVVQVGHHILVQDGIISLAQDVSPDASVTFDSMNVISQLTLAGESVVTEVMPTAGSGIQIDNLVQFGPTVSFDVTNMGVLSLTAGTGITLSGATGDITISSSGADLIRVVGVTTNYTVAQDDEYVGVNSTSAVMITLPSGVPGRVYYIKDERGQGSGKITIQPQTGELIDGKVNYVISVPYQCVSMVFRSGAWWII